MLAVFLFEERKKEHGNSFLINNLEDFPPSSRVGVRTGSPWFDEPGTKENRHHPEVFSA